MVIVKDAVLKLKECPYDENPCDWCAFTDESCTGDLDCGSGNGYFSIVSYEALEIPNKERR